MLKMRTLAGVVTLLWIGTASAALWIGTASAATLWVANNGQDAGSCAPSSSPCRTISFALVNAANGDTIKVGPGLYGDLDNDGLLGEAGEEAGLVCGSGVCAIRVSTGVTIESTHGADATILSVTGSAAGGIVSIQTGGVKFGKANKGFTFHTSISSLTAASIFIHPVANPVTVEGNKIVQSGGASFGIRVLGDNAVIKNNTIVDVDGDMSCIDVSGSGTELIGNRLSGCVGGIELASGSNWTMTGNVVSGGSTGLVIRYPQASSPLLFKNNSFIGTSIGIFVILSDITPGGHAVILTNSNIVGSTYFLNCGAQIDASAEPDGDPFSLDLVDFYFGAPTGPGPDPADALCPDGAAAINATTIATTMYNVKPKPIR